MAAVLAVAVGLACPSGASAQSAPHLSLGLEGASVWSRRNDVRIPPDTGTPFSIVDLIGSGPADAVRAEAVLGLGSRHSLRFVYAPLIVEGRGTPQAAIAFAGGSFAPGVETDAQYKFSSYRGTYRYRFYAGPTWQWRVGFTAFVRDARIALTQAGQTAEDTDVGFVPLGHVSGDGEFGRWRLSLEADASAAPQGRAIDAAAILKYRLLPGVTLGAGYRTIEGGADVDRVYTFAWLNAAVVRLGLEF